MYLPNCQEPLKNVVDCCPGNRPRRWYSILYPRFYQAHFTIHFPSGQFFFMSLALYLSSIATNAAVHYPLQFNIVNFVFLNTEMLSHFYETLWDLFSVQMYFTTVQVYLVFKSFNQLLSFLLFHDYFRSCPQHLFQEPWTFWSFFVGKKLFCMCL